MKQNGPWQIKSSKTVYKNAWISVREDEVIRPDGKNEIYGLVNATKGAYVLPIDDDLNVYLVDEFRYALKERSIETVSGGNENDETILETAKRELLEEAGITADEWIDLGLINPLTSCVVSPQQLFIAKNLSFKDSKPDDTEDIKLMKMPLAQAIKMVENGKITLASSCCLILRVARLYNL